MEASVTKAVQFFSQAADHGSVRLPIRSLSVRYPVASLSTGPRMHLGARNICAGTQLFRTPNQPRSSTAYTPRDNLSSRRSNPHGPRMHLGCIAMYRGLIDTAVVRVTCLVALAYANGAIDDRVIRET